MLLHRPKSYTVLLNNHHQQSTTFREPCHPGSPAKVRDALRPLTLEALAEKTAKGQQATRLREAAKASFDKLRQLEAGAGYAANAAGGRPPDAQRWLRNQVSSVMHW